MKIAGQYVTIARMQPTQSNRQRQEQVVAELARLLKAVCQRGFYGAASVTVNLQDGHIQDLRVATDRRVR